MGRRVKSLREVRKQSTKVVIDTDPGTDDALAIIMALNSPELDVLALTAVGGNARLAHTTRNALRMLEYMGRPDIPVSPGAARPIRGHFRYAYHFHGPGGLTARLPLPKSSPAAMNAPERIIGLASSFPGEVLLLALGPLTNVARAMTKEPRVAVWLKEIVVMGGAVGVSGNVTPHAEFNIYNDPLAAQIVLSSSTPVRLVGLDVCSRVVATPEDAASLRGTSDSAKLARRLLANWFASHGGASTFKLCDPLAVVAAIEPEVLTYRRTSIAVEVEDRELMGRTTAAHRPGTVEVATAVHADGAKRLIAGLLRANDRPQAL